MGATVATLVGGPNSGHTVIDGSGTPCIFGSTDCGDPRRAMCVPPGSYIALTFCWKKCESPGRAGAAHDLKCRCDHESWGRRSNRTEVLQSDRQRAEPAQRLRHELAESVKLGSHAMSLDLRFFWLAQLPY